MPTKKRSVTPKKSSGKGNRGRSPTRSPSVSVEQSHRIQHPDSLQADTESLSNEWIVSRSENQLIGALVNIETMKSMKLHPGSLVIIHPSIMVDHAATLPQVILPIYVSTSCLQKNIQLKKWQRETLLIPLGYSVHITPYHPSPQPIHLSYMRVSRDKSKEATCEELSQILNPLESAEKITLISTGTQPLTEALHSLVLSNLMTRKYVNTNTSVLINYFGQKYSFRIEEIEAPKDCFEFDPGNSNSLKCFVVHSKTAIRLKFQEKSQIGEDNKIPIAIGGLQDQLDYIESQIQLCLYQWSEFKRYGLKAPRGILLFGPPGTGKTLLVKVLSSKLNCSLFIINGPEIMGKIHGESEGRLRDVFEQAKQQQPSIIFIDEIDAICSKRESLESEYEKRIVSQLLSSMDELHDCALSTPQQGQDEIESSVVVLAATNRPNALDAALRRPGRFDREIEIGIPNPQQRREIIDVYMNSVKHTLSEDDLNYFANSTHGYVGADLAALCREACIHSLLRSQIISEVQPASLIKKIESTKIEENREEILVTAEDMKRAMGQIRPSAMRELMIEVPKVKWSDIGGNENIKQSLKEAVEWPLRYPEAFERMGIRPPRGILLYGPPGCSKTMMAKALATEAGLNFIAVKGPELFSKWVGESERAIRELFRKARAAAPSIVFFDEIDALAITRGGSDAGGVADRVLSQLLTELDGVEPLKKVTVVAATNRPDIIDKALLRPGRIDRIVYVGLPDEEARKHIIQLHLNKIPSENIDLPSLVEKTGGYSGAEVVAVCREASMFALSENINIESVTMAHFVLALEKVKPRISSDVIAFYRKFQTTIKL